MGVPDVALANERPHGTEEELQIAMGHGQANCHASENAGKEICASVVLNEAKEAIHERSRRLPGEVM